MLKVLVTAHNIQAVILRWRALVEAQNDLYAVDGADVNLDDSISLCLSHPFVIRVFLGKRLFYLNMDYVANSISAELLTAKAINLIRD